jgi:hypothetical protein
MWICDDHSLYWHAECALHASLHELNTVAELRAEERGMKWMNSNSLETDTLDYTCPSKIPQESLIHFHNERTAALEHNSLDCVNISPSSLP